MDMDRARVRWGVAAKVTNRISLSSGTYSSRKVLARRFRGVDCGVFLAFGVGGGGIEEGCESREGADTGVADERLRDGPKSDTIQELSRPECAGPRFTPASAARVVSVDEWVSGLDMGDMGEEECNCGSELGTSERGDGGARYC